MVIHTFSNGKSTSKPGINKIWPILLLLVLICGFAQIVRGSTADDGLPGANLSDPQVNVEKGEAKDLVPEDVIAAGNPQVPIPAPILHTPPALNPVAEIDYGKPHSSSGSQWIGNMGWGIIFILVTLVISPGAMTLYTNITPFVVGGALGGLAHEIESGGRKYTSAALGGAATGFLFPLAIALIGPLGLYYFAGRPLLHALGDAEAVLCCTKTEYWRLDELKVSPDGRWLALVTVAPKPVFGEKTADNYAYLIDLKRARYIDWPGTDSEHYQVLHTPKQVRSTSGLIDIDFDTEKGGLLAYYGSSYINRTEISGVQRIETGSLGLKNFQLAGADPQILVRTEIIGQAGDRFDVEDQRNGDQFSINVSSGWERYELSADGRVLALIHPEVDSSSSPWAFLSSVFVGRWEVEFWDLEQRKLVKRYTQYLFDINRWVNKDYFKNQPSPFLHGTPDGRRWFVINGTDNSITIFDLSDKVRPALSIKANTPAAASLAAM